MKRSTILGAAVGMLLLILDSRCAAQSAQNAIDLCLKTVIPSLFPMFVLSSLLVSGISGASGRAFSAMEGIIGLPREGIGLFLLGIVGGFPVGAQCIAQAVERGSLSKSDGERMLGFCNNCSPAFLFGIVGSLFSNPATPLLIFLIQLETALLVASFTDFSRISSVTIRKQTVSLSEAVSRGIRSMVSVCAWVVLAGVVTGFLKRWVYPVLPMPLPQIISGCVEVTGGVLGLAQMPDEWLRFLLCTIFVCFGGFSVWMQIASLASPQKLSITHCCGQKALQALLGGSIAIAVRFMGLASLVIPMILLAFRKKRLENPTANVYNGSHKGGIDHVVP